MKNRKNIAILLSCLFMTSSGLLNACEKHDEDPHYVWFEGDEVAVQEDGIYADSNKGIIKLNVVEYDRVNNRYKVLCRCLQNPKLDSGEALSVPFKLTLEDLVNAQ